MRASGGNLSRKQELLIAALLACDSITEAAAQCGLAEATAYRWLKDAGFQGAYRESRRAVVQQAVVQVQQATGTAVTTLLEVMRDGSAAASAKVRAAQVVLEMALRAVEIEDLETRIAVLEATQTERT